MRTTHLAALAFAACLAASQAAFAADSDGDGVPDDIEPSEALNPSLKDNDIQGSARLFAMQQYRDFLGREGEAAGIAFYQNAITTGAMTRTQVIEAFLGSPEFQNGLPQCTRLYFATFLRIPDYAGLIFQVSAFRAGTPLDVIANNFTLSPEFQSRYGALTDPQYVALLYQNILGRTASQPEIDFHVARLVSGVSRGSVLVGFSESPEFQQLMAQEVYVTAVYVGMLRRAPEQAGLDFYVNQIETGLPPNAIIIGFNGSPEYHVRFMPPPNLVATQRLLSGTWTFTYTVAATTFQDTYTFTSVNPVNPAGDYVAVGTDAASNDVLGGYVGAQSQWGVLDIEATFDKIFLFTFGGTDQVSGCMHMAPPGTEVLGTCYPMTGVRSPLLGPP